MNQLVTDIPALPVILNDDLAVIGVSRAAAPGLVAAGRLDIAERLVVRRRWVFPHGNWVGVGHADGDDFLALDIDLALAALAVTMAVTLVCGAGGLGTAGGPRGPGARL